jgi:hypothetical protein
MEIATPIYNANPISYTFRIGKCSQQVEELVYYENETLTRLPANITDGVNAILDELLEKIKKYFTNPLSNEKVLRHLRLTIVGNDLPKSAGWYSFIWKPVEFIVKSGEFTLGWHVAEYKASEPMIPADFTASTTPRAQSPVPEQTADERRSIQIKDSLIPVGDLPLSDLPPLSFGTEDIDPAREEIRRRIREARLKVQLAKLKAQRMEQKYYERYGQTAEDSEDSSEFSTDSEEEVPF